MYVVCVCVELPSSPQVIDAYGPDSLRLYLRLTLLCVCRPETIWVKPVCLCVCVVCVCMLCVCVMMMICLPLQGTPPPNTAADMAHSTHSTQPALRVELSPPSQVIDAYGADSLRLYLINSPVVRAEDLCFKEAGVMQNLKSIFLPWYHAYRLLVASVRTMEIKEVNICIYIHIYIYIYY